MSTNRAQRRSFFKKFGTLTAGLGALMGGLLPEVKAASIGAAGATTPIADPALPAEDENRLYAEALNNVDVASLVAAAGQSVRLDPPTRSFNSVNGAQRAVAVLMPLTSYATGQPVAMLYFGSATTVDSNGASMTLPLRMSISNDGILRVGLGGAVQVPSAPEAAETLFASYFPDQYAASLDVTFGLNGGQQTTQMVCIAPVDTPMPILPSSRRSLGATPLQEKTAMTVQQCKDQLLNCLRGSVFACVTGGVGTVVCVVCIAACIMGTWGTGCFACVVACGGAIGAGGTCYILLQSCRDQYVGCRRQCVAQVSPTQQI